jgi:hypothetical protein
VRKRRRFVALTILVKWGNDCRLYIPKPLCFEQTGQLHKLHRVFLAQVDTVSSLTYSPLIIDFITCSANLHTLLLLQTVILAISCIPPWPIIPLDSPIWQVHRQSERQAPSPFPAPDSPSPHIQSIASGNGRTLPPVLRKKHTNPNQAVPTHPQPSCTLDTQSPCFEVFFGPALTFQITPSPPRISPEICDDT